MTTLAFDTSTDIMGICLKSDDRYFTYTAKAGLKHSENLLSQIEHLYKSSGIDKKTTELIICAKGPGSFTGLRIGMSIAKGLADGFGIPMVSVPTLDILVYDYDYFDGAVIPVMDAKSGKVFTAVYQNGERTGDYLDIKKDELGEILSKYKKVLLTGSYASEIKTMYAESGNLILDANYDDCKIHGCAALGEKLYNSGIIDPENSGPIYIRASEAELTRKK